MIQYHAVPLELRREEKLHLVRDFGSLSSVDWKRVNSTEKGSWFPTKSAPEFDRFISISTKAAKESVRTTPDEVIFHRYSLGVSTNRDRVAYDFQISALLEHVEEFCENYNSELDRYLRHEKRITNLDDFLDVDKLKWSRNLKRQLRQHRHLAFDASLVRKSLYRPFTVQEVYLADIVIDELGLTPVFFPTVQCDQENAAILVPTIGNRSKSWMPFATRLIPNLNMTSIDAAQCFPFYVYDEDGTNRRENITDWAVAQFQRRYGDASIGKWDVFYYVYGLLHHAGYREKFADNLKRELPRIPVDPACRAGSGEDDEREDPARQAEPTDFRAFADAGRKLADLHLNYEQLEPYSLEWIESPDAPLSYRVERMRLSKDKKSLVVNDSLTLAGIPREVFDYRLGNRSALEWVIDQYRVKTDKRSGITSDPNRQDDPEYIVRLVGQVVRVSMETIDIVSSLPQAFAASPKASHKKKHK